MKKLGLWRKQHKMETSEKKILFLTLKKQYFDQIKSGEKTSEFREYKPFWINRLMNEGGSFRHYDLIKFQNGYHKNAPQLIVEFKGIKINKNKINWFQSEKEFEIELGEIIK